MDQCEVSNIDLTEAEMESDTVSEEHSSSSSSLLPSTPGLDLVVRRGSSCRVLHPLPTIVQPEHTEQTEIKTYIKKDELTEEETTYNWELFEETVANEFPEEDMADKSFRDKDKDWVIKTWILRVLDEDSNEQTSKVKKEKRIAQSEDLPFILQSGIVLCKLASSVVPGIDIDIDQLQSGNLMTKRRNISLFLEAASAYGVPLSLLFSPDDLTVQAHVYKVTRTMFAFAELTNLCPEYSGPIFDFDIIFRELIDQGIRRKSSVTDMNKVHTNINTIFANLMQDVERRTSLSPKGPPSNIYSCD